MNLNKLPGYTNTEKASGDSLPIIKIFPGVETWLAGWKIRLPFQLYGVKIYLRLFNYGKDYGAPVCAAKLARMGSSKFTPADEKNYEALIVSGEENITVSLPQVHSHWYCNACNG